MKALAILSIAINVVVAGYVVNFRQPTQPVQRQEKSTNESSMMKSSFIARRPAGPKTETFVVSNLPLSDFHWRRVESDDYRAYIANLRAIGCPEETIRDIIIADVEKLYAKRLAPLRKPEEEFKFWTTGNSVSGSDQAAEFYKAQREFAKEKKELLKQLLGANYEKELAKQYGGGSQLKDPLEHLPRETRDKASELYQKFSEQQSDVYQKAKGSIDSTTQNELRVLKRQLHDDLAKVLSAEDLFEFEVRTSDVARNVKYELQAFEATEEEFRAIFKAKQNVEFLNAGADDGLKAALGEARYMEYKRAEDSDYQNLFRLADSRGLERTTVDQIYQLKDEAQEAAKEVRRNKDLSEDQRTAALAAIRAETEKTVMQALGEKNFKTYKRYAYWIRNIAPPPPIIAAEVGINQKFSWCLVFGVWCLIRLMFKPSDLFDLSQTEHAALFEGCEHAWDALKKIKEYIARNVRPALHNRCLGRAWIGESVFIGEGTVVEDGVMIKGPAIIGKNCQIRHNAYLREDVIVGDGCVVGNSCEFKNALLFNGAQVPHFSYVGDSILGYKAHLGAGVKISNLKLTPGNISVEWEKKAINTGLRKFGAVIGDHAEVGCNAVLNPGSVLGRASLIYPNTNWRGVLAARHIAKNRAEVEIATRRA